MTTAATPGSDSNRIDSAEASALYVEDRFSVGDMIITAGARYEEITVMRDDWGKTDPDRSEVPTDRKHTMTVLVPGFSVEYPLSDTQSISLGIHKGFAPPGPGTSGVTAEEVDPERDPEFLQSFFELTRDEEEYKAKKIDDLRKSLRRF